MSSGVAAGLLGLLAGPGCSFIFVQGPPPPSANAVQIDCVGGMWAPVVDTVLTTPPTLLLVSRASQSDADHDDALISRNWDLAIGATTLALLGASAIFGYVRVSQCHAAKEEENAQIARRYGANQLYDLRRPKAPHAPAGDQQPGAAPVATEGRWPEDDVIAQAYGGKVVRSCWLKPAPDAGAPEACVLRGDFDGDGRPDAAVLVAEAAEPRRKGIALLTSDAERSLVGAGNAVGNGGDDFSWMDAWRVSTKADTTRALGRAAGDGLIVEKTESAGGLIGIVAGRPQWAQWSD